MTEILMYGIVGDEWDRLDAKTLVPMITDGDDDLDIRINSPGGYVMEGLAIFNAIVREKAAGRKVTTHIDGLAASMASVIAMAGEEILMADNALMMIHNPWDIAIGDAAELRRAADKLDRIRDQLVNIYAGKSGVANDELIAMLNAETWMDSTEALAMNFITSITQTSTAAACDVSAFGFRKVPENPRIDAMASLGKPKAAPAVGEPSGGNMVDVTKKPAGNEKPAENIDVQAVATQAAEAATKAERERTSAIRTAVARARLDASFGDELVSAGVSVEDARAKILDKLAEQSDGQQIGHNSPARVTVDQREKFREGATNWLLVKAGVAPLVEKAAAMKGQKITIDPGEFRGVRNVDLARESLANIGVNLASRDPEAIVREAMTARGAVITQTTSDFPVLFEAAIHRTLQAAYATTPDTWSRFCGTGTVTDFRDHNRYLRGTFGALDTVNEAGEFKNKPIPDLAKEKIKATTKGNIINLSRQAIVNDDMEVFSGLAVDLGRAAKLTIEIDVYALLNSNPTMNDGIALFHASHGNLAGVGAAPSMAAFDAIGVAMASQKDLSGNEFLEIEPTVLLVPRSIRGLAISINGSEYDPDVASKLQKPNIVKNMFSDIVGTPRLTGTAYYAFADKDSAPAIEVVFLNGVTEPFTDSEEGWRVDGVEWKVRHDYGVGAVNWRSAYKQPGA